MRKILLGLAATAALVTPLAALAAPANAADGDTPLNITFDGLNATSPLSAVGASTDLIRRTPAGLRVRAEHHVGRGPVHHRREPERLPPALGGLGGATDNMLFVNGAETQSQTVLEASVPGVTCDTPGSTVTYTFGANMANILPLDQFSNGGAEITVLINDVPLGSETC